MIAAALYFLPLYTQVPRAFFSVVDPLHIYAAVRFFGTAAQAFVNPWSARLNVIANRCRRSVLGTWLRMPGRCAKLPKVA
jgi:hypothetical protein